MLASACVLGALAIAGPTAASPASPPPLPPPPDSVTVPPGPPLVQGTPHKVRNLPCGVRGPALNLDDGSHYDTSRGTLRAAMIFVDFSDAPADASASPQEVYDRLVPDTAARLRDLSYGKLRLSVKPDLRWVRMPRPLAAYGLSDQNPQTAAAHRRYITDAIHAADPSFDFSKIDTVYVMAGPGVDKRGATANFAPGRGAKADGHRIDHAMTLNSYGPSINAEVLTHETGHVMGLPDLYDVHTLENWDRWVGPWDLMSDVWKNNTMLAWTRRLVGWLGDRDFRCVHTRTTVTLTPVATPGGVKAAVVRTGARSAYAIEARSAADGPNCPAAGVLVYRVNMNVGTGAGPDHVFDAAPSDGSCGAHSDALFKPAGEGVPRFADKRVDVTVLRAVGDGFRVEVRALRH
jgi:M6 family metalloprotease-like protein